MKLGCGGILSYECYLFGTRDEYLRPVRQVTVPASLILMMAITVPSMGLMFLYFLEIRLECVRTAALEFQDKMDTC